jgi:alpha/beta superfamily hydrolase
LPFVITAAGYVEKYGPDERYNFLKFLADVRCPTLITLGAKELQNNVAFQGLPLELEQLTSARPQVQMIPGADHFYTGTRTELVNVVARWLGGALPAGTTF